MVRANAAGPIAGRSGGAPMTGQRMPAFAELDVVRLARDVASVVGVIPQGTEATVLQVFDGGDAYLVEFEGAYEAPETVRAGDLERGHGRPA